MHEQNCSIDTMRYLAFSLLTWTDMLTQATALRSLETTLSEKSRCKSTGLYPKFPEQSVYRDKMLSLEEEGEEDREGQRRAGDSLMRIRVSVGMRAIFWKRVSVVTQQTM